MEFNKQATRATIAFRFRIGLLITIGLYSCFLGYACTNKPALPPESAFTAPSSHQNVKIENSQDYLASITSFYQQIITILSIVIGILLVVSFVYLHTTSKLKADEMAHEALEGHMFQSYVKSLVAQQYKSKGQDLSYLLDNLESLDARLTFLEEQLNRDGGSSTGATDAPVVLPPPTVVPPEEGG